MRELERGDVTRDGIEGSAETSVADADRHVRNHGIGEARHVVAERDVTLLLELDHEGERIMDVAIPGDVLPAHHERVGRRERLPELRMENGK